MYHVKDCHKCFYVCKTWYAHYYFAAQFLTCAFVSTTLANYHEDHLRIQFSSSSGLFRSTTSYTTFFALMKSQQLLFQIQIWSIFSEDTVQNAKLDDIPVTTENSKFIGLMAVFSLSGSVSFNGLLSNYL